MKAGDRDTLVWMQNAEPLSLYCADETDGETLRACEQIDRNPSTPTRSAARTPSPALADGVHAERRAHGLDVQAARGRDLPRRRRLRRERRGRQSSRPSGTWRTRSTWAAPAPSSTSPACSAGSSTRPHPPSRISSPKVHTTGAPHRAPPFPQSGPSSLTVADTHRVDPLHRSDASSLSDPGPARDRVHRVRARADDPGRPVPGRAG